jgi:acyl transferase domain-containing protein
VSGTNVHVIIEEPAPLEVPAPTGERRARLEGSGHTYVPWPLSGFGEDGLRRQAQSLARFLAQRPELDIADVGRSLANRPTLSDRAVLIGASRAELLDALEKVAAGDWSLEALGGGSATEVTEAEGTSDTELAAGVEDAGSRETLASLARTWVAGGAVDWEPVFAELDARPVRLPTYAFARHRHWVDHSPVWAASGPVVEVGRQVAEAVAIAPDVAALVGASTTAGHTEQ